MRFYHLIVSKAPKIFEERRFYHLIVSKAPKIFEACFKLQATIPPRSDRPLASDVSAFGKTVPMEGGLWQDSAYGAYGRNAKIQKQCAKTAATERFDI